jgi:uncharacterized membrane protein YphA (DoxX/SURF4 family)
MKYILLRLKRFCGFITGFVFFIGGILKLMDPVGTGLIMGEYMDFLHLKFLGFAAKPLGVAFALAETVIGTALITGVFRRITGFAAMAFQGFFTLLTLALVIFNPQMDCGCFGEAIHLTHMQTFLKNIVLCILLCAYFFPQKLLGEPRSKKYVTFAVVTTSVIAFMTYSWMYIPLVDYTAYKPGAVLKASEAAPAEEAFEAVFIYEKDGNEAMFDLEHLPDSTWTFVRTETVAAEGSAAEDIVDLSFYDGDGEYMDESAAEGKVMVVSLYRADIGARKWEEISEFVQNAEEAGFKAIVLASDVPADTHGLVVYTADYKTLLAMNRSNGGVTYFSDGNLIRKWAFRARPDMERLNELYSEDATETVIYHNAKGSLAFQGFLLYVFAVMLLL